MRYEVVEDRKEPGTWRVEGFDSEGRCYLAIFYGPKSEERARAYAASLAEPAG